MIRIVLFDLDDTLAAEDNFIRSGYRHIAGILKDKYSLTDAEKTCQRLYELYLEDSRNVFNRALSESGIEYNKEDILYLVNEYRNHMPDTYFYEDVIPTLKLLTERNIKTGIITDGYLNGQKNKAKALKLDSYFEKIIYTDELGKDYWKPSPMAFDMMKDYFDVEYEEMAYVGDNPEKDFYIRHDRNIHTIRIVRPTSVYENREYRENIEAEYCIRSLTEIEAILDENVK